MKKNTKNTKTNRIYDSTSLKVSSDLDLDLFYIRQRINALEKIVAKFFDSKYFKKRSAICAKKSLN